MSGGDGTRRIAPWAWAIFGLALVVRLAHLWLLRDSAFLEATLGDAGAYDAWARRLAAGDWLGSEVFYQAPLYPYLLGGVYATLGDDPLTVRALQAFASAAGCALLAAAGARLVSRGAGIAAGLLLAVYAPSIFLDLLIQKSVLDLFLSCLAIWLAARLVGAPGLGLAAALGLALGALMLARENAAVLVAVFAGLVATLPGLERGRRVALVLALAGGVAGALVPVAVRNAWVGGELHLTTSQLGPNLYIGNHPGAKGIYEPLLPGRGSWEYERHDATALAEEAAGRTLTPGEVSSYWTGRVVDYVVSDPLDWLWLMGRKAVLLVGSVELVDSEDQYAVADESIVLRAAGAVVHFGVLAPLALLGGFVLWPERRRLWWIYAAVGAYAASVVLFYVFARYRYPLVPFLALLAGAGITGVRSWARLSPRGVRVACGIAVLALAVFANGVSGLDRDRMRAVTHANLGVFFEQAGRGERALEHYERALDLDPAIERVVEAFGRTSLALGRIDEARAFFEERVAPRLDATQRELARARMLRAQGSRAAALDPLRRAHAAAPGDGEARAELVALELELASDRLEQGAAAEALAHYRGAIAADPGQPAALWGAAWLLATQPGRALGDPAQAAELAERARRLGAPMTPSTLEVLAASRAAAGRFEQASRLASEAEARLQAQGLAVPPRLARARALYARGERFRLRAPAAR